MSRCHNLVAWKHLKNMAQFALIRGLNHKIEMTRTARRLLACGLIALGLHACADRAPRVAPAPSGQQPVWSGQPGPSSPGGLYKVGSPYQIAGTWYYPREDFDYRETGIASWYGPGFHNKTTANGETYNSEDLTAAHRTLPMPSVVRVTNLENGRTIKVRINDRGPFARGRIIDVSRRAAELLGFEHQGTAKVMVEIVEDESRQLASAALNGTAVASAPRAVPLVAVTAEPLAGTAPASPSVQPGSGQTALAVTNSSDIRPSELTNGSDVVVVGRPATSTDIYVQAGAFTNFDNANRLRARLAALGNVRIASALVEDTQYFRVQLGPLSTVDTADRLLDMLLANGHNEARVVID